MIKEPSIQLASVVLWVACLVSNLLHPSNVQVRCRASLKLFLRAFLFLIFANFCFKQLSPLQNNLKFKLKQFWVTSFRVFVRLGYFPDFQTAWMVNKRWVNRIFSAFICGRLCFSERDDSHPLQPIKSLWTALQCVLRVLSDSTWMSWRSAVGQHSRHSLYFDHLEIIWHLTRPLAAPMCIRATKLHNAMEYAETEIKWSELVKFQISTLIAVFSPSNIYIARFIFQSTCPKGA